MIALVDGIILAAGKASRVGQNKLLLEYRGQPIIYYPLRILSEICENVTLVTGHYKIDYASMFLEFDNIFVVHNENYNLGMFSSVKKGVEVSKNDILLIPGDYPLVKKETFQALLHGTGDIRVPIYKGKKGHPIFISRSLRDELLNDDPASNLKVFRDKHKVNYIDVDDEGILIDIDHFEDYNRILKTEREK